MTSPGAGNAGTGATGSGNSFFGFAAGGISTTYGLTTTVFTNCIGVGQSNGVVTEGITLTNTSFFGNNIFTNVSNVCMIGGNQAAQNIMLVAPNNQADLGSRVQMFGSLSMPFRFTATSSTLTSADFTVIFTTAATPTCTLPVASTVIGRIYNIVAQGAGVTVALSQNVTQFNGVNTTSVLPSTGIKIQATASGWAQIP
jgi:hypothetical protein